MPIHGLEKCVGCDKGRMAYYGLRAGDTVKPICGYCRKACAADKEASVFELEKDKDAKRKMIGVAWSAIRKRATKAAVPGIRGTLRVLGNKLADGRAMRICGGRPGCPMSPLDTPQNRYIRLQAKWAALPIFPNHDHNTYATDDSFGDTISTHGGLAMGALSPKVPHHPSEWLRLGAEEVGTVEGCIQGVKLYPGDWDEAAGELTARGAAEREHMLTRGLGNAEPCPRWKTCAGERVKKRDGCTGAVVRTDAGQWRKLSYVQLRYGYCKAYELTRGKHPHIRTLRELLAVGISVTLVGYDGPAEGDASAENMYERYCSPVRPFGHELVVWCLVELPPDQYPWNRYRAEHPSVYEGITVSVVRSNE